MDWLRMPGSNFTPEASKNQGAIFKTFLSTFAIFMFNYVEFLRSFVEIREYFQKKENYMDSCRIHCQNLRTFSDISGTE